ncbi:glycosyltransferase family 4 protein [Actinoplanes palleronii]|uniref:Glycosyl transferase family 1 domain-containing protein n=1 Tax=Actinoplanes palleronii TaxID=113570 RepID=A0ABQ4BNJ0_9ACTN|nr:glycosyltransferase family 4 protein [Actinoplanes palleronii]GIE72256.1 hypothetical protein Apa02nite_083640 [Actinoplanes palleronii]
MLHNAYGTGGTIRTVVNQANALCDIHDVEIASVYRSAEAPVFALDPRVRLVSLTDLREDGSRWTDPAGKNSRFWRKTRRFPSPLPQRADFRYGRWDPLVDLKVLRYFREQRDGALITTRPALNLMSAWFAPRELIRIGQDHLNFASYPAPLQAAITRAYPRLDAVTVLTRTDLTTYRGALGDSVRLERIPNGTPPPAADVPENDRGVVLVAAGRLIRQKGFDLLIEAFRLVHAEHPEWQLRIFGEGKARRKLTARIAELGLGDVVHLRGRTRDLESELGRASIFVLSSRKEGLPMVLLEAMSTGLPVVSFDCPTGPAEVVVDGVNGVLVPAEDVPGLAAGMSRLITNGHERSAMGKAARATGAEYAMPVIAGQWEKLFAELSPGRLG